MEQQQYKPTVKPYRKLPVIIDAIQFTNESKDIVYNFVTCNKSADFDKNGDPILKIWTLEGAMITKLGDWVIYLYGLKKRPKRPKRL